MPTLTKSSVFITRVGPNERVDTVKYENN
jgi:hypothetical protein